MAINKSTSNRWLTVHVLAYMIAFSPFSMYMDYYINGNKFVGFGNINACYWWITNGCLHWITDYFTSRLTSSLWKQEKRHWFFCAIGFDQVIHYGCLLFTYQYFFQ